MDEFLDYATKNVPKNNELLYCPCVKCLNSLCLGTREIKDHLICFGGFYKAYTIWVLHGESKKVVYIKLKKMIWIWIKI